MVSNMTCLLLSTQGGAHIEGIHLMPPRHGADGLDPEGNVIELREWRWSEGDTVKDRDSVKRRPFSRDSAVAAPVPKGLQRIVLPTRMAGRGMSVLAALERRKTNRSISDRKLPRQMLSNLLWAACGVNRRRGPFGTPGRTAASASNSQEIDLYVALEEGVYHYEPVLHCLTPVVAGDLRELAIGQGQGIAGANAPVRLIYVADIGKFAKAGFQEPGLKDPEIQKSYYYVDAGLIAENVYLFAASQGLAAWFHNCNRAKLTARLRLKTDQRALFGQTVGYPERG
jgi:SagB-type dehydrogenase family enzyme